MNPILLDTHVAVWAASEDLPKSTVEVIEAAAERDELLLSPITAWEIGVLVNKARLKLAPSVHDYVRGLFSRSGVVVAALTPAIAVAATMLPGNLHRDPADRILVATAAAYGAQLLTRDKSIHAYAKATKHIRTLAC